MSSTRQSRRLLYERLIGQTVGDRYKIVSLMGFGGMGAVYEAVQQNMNRRVALKYIPSHDPITAARFEREALTVSQLCHPNTVTVFDFGSTDDGFLYLSMELLNGRTLTEVINGGGPLPPARAVHIASQMCRSLAEAHQMGIVHRDIKPDNVILIEVDGDPDVVKVLDFGIAKAVSGDDDVQLTGDGRIVGTPRYMSPEQILSDSIDHRSDIYSLGCIIFEMLCGVPPFKASNTTALMLSHAQQDPPSLAERLSEHALSPVPFKLDQIVQRTLAKDPDQRPQTTDELRQLLEEAIQGFPGVRPVPTFATNDPSSTVFAADTAPLGSAPLTPDTATDPAESSPRSFSPLILGFIILVLFALVLGGLTFWSKEEPETDPLAETTTEALPPERPDSEEFAAPTPSPPNEPDSEPDVAINDTIHVRIVTEPSGVSVFEDDEALGTTPFNLSVPGDTGELQFQLRADGYQSRDVTLNIAVEPGQTQAFSFELDAQRPARRPPRQTPRNEPDEEAPPPEEPAEPRIPQVPILDDPGTTQLPRIDRL